MLSDSTLFGKRALRTGMKRLRMRNGDVEDADEEPEEDAEEETDGS